MHSLTHSSTHPPHQRQTWDLETGEYEKTLKGHTNAVTALAFNRQGTLLASCSSDLSIKLWDFGPSAAQECLRTLRGHDHNISDVVFLPSGDQLVSCSRCVAVYFLSCVGRFDACAWDGGRQDR